jgi:fatty-acyl-CoA synthase
LSTDFHTVPLAEALLEGARSHPDRDCIVLVDERVTYGELADRARRVGRSLIAMGVQRGDRVGILMANCLDFTDLLFGASMIGAVPVLYNARFKVREIAHVTTDAGVKVVFTNDIIEQHTDYVQLLDKADVHSSPTMEQAVFLGQGEREHFMSRAGFEALADSVDPHLVEERHEGTAIEDMAIMFYTSGTTAMPKGCPLDHIVLQHAGVYGGVDRFQLEDGDVVWGPLPMFHSAFTQPLSGVLSVGGTFVSMTHFDAGDAIDLIMREGVTAAFPAFPTITMQLLNHPRYTSETFRSIQVMLNVGPPEELVAMQERMPHTKQITSFGMSECGGSLAMCEPDDSLALRSECSGLALPGIEIEIRHPETGASLEPGERGEICASGRGVFTGYYNDPEKTAASFHDDGFFRTGDLGVADADGRMTFKGRLKDMLKVGGENVAAIEVEGYLATHPAVNLAQVVGLPDDKYDEVPVAFIELASGAEATEDEIIAFCRGEIASFKIPRHVRFVEDWPMGATKILKYELRDRICAELGVES